MRHLRSYICFVLLASLASPAISSQSNKRSTDTLQYDEDSDDSTDKRKKIKLETFQPGSNKSSSLILKLPRPKKRERTEDAHEEETSSNLKFSKSESASESQQIARRYPERSKLLNIIKSLAHKRNYPNILSKLEELSLEQQEVIAFTINRMLADQNDPKSYRKFLVFILSKPVRNREKTCHQSYEICRYFSVFTLHAFQGVYDSIRQAPSKRLAELPSLLQEFTSPHSELDASLKLLRRLCFIEANKLDSVRKGLRTLETHLAEAYPSEQEAVFAEFMTYFPPESIDFAPNKIIKLLRNNAMDWAIGLARRIPNDIVGRVFSRITLNNFAFLFWREKINEVGDNRVLDILTPLAATHWEQYKDIIHATKDVFSKIKDKRGINNIIYISKIYDFFFLREEEFITCLSQYMPDNINCLDLFLEIEGALDYYQLEAALDFLGQPCSSNEYLDPPAEFNFRSTYRTISSLSEDKKNKFVGILSKLTGTRTDTSASRCQLFIKLAEEAQSNNPVGSYLAKTNETTKLSISECLKIMSIIEVNPKKRERTFSLLTKFLKTARYKEQKCLQLTNPTLFSNYLLLTNDCIQRNKFAEDIFAKILAKLSTLVGMGKSDGYALLTQVDICIQDLYNIHAIGPIAAQNLYPSLIVNIGRIPADQREIYLKQALLITESYLSRLRPYYGEDEEVDGDISQIQVNFNDTLTYLREIPVENLETAVTACLKLAQDTFIDDRSIALISKGLQFVPSDRQEAILNALKTIDSDHLNWSASFQNSVITALRLSPEARYNNILDLANRFLEQDNSSKKLAEIIFSTLPMIPPSQSDIFFQNTIDFHKGYNNEIPFFFLSHDQSLETHALHFLENDPEGADELFKYWTEIIEGENEGLSKTLYKFVIQNYEDLGLDMDTPIVQTAIIYHTAMDPMNKTNPSLIYRNLLEKKKAAVHWGSLRPVKKQLGGVTFTLNAEKLSKLGASIQLDLTTTPHFSLQNYLDLIQELKALLHKDSEAIEMAVQIIKGTVRNQEGLNEQEVLNKAYEDFLSLLEQNMKANAYMYKLVSCRVPHLEASKLRCVLAHLNSIEDKRERCKKLFQFFASVRNCSTGQATAINDYYTQLPNARRIQSKGVQLNFTEQTLPAIQVLHTAIQSSASNKFSADGRFLRDLCQIKPGQNIPEAVHQIKYAKGLIGNLIGLPESAARDIHAQCILQKLLDTTTNEALQIYYQQADGDEFIASVRLGINYLIHSETDEERNKLYRGLEKIHKAMESTVESFEDWVDLHEDTFVFDQITTTGIVRLMEYVGLFDKD